MYGSELLVDVIKLPLPIESKIKDKKNQCVGPSIEASRTHTRWLSTITRMLLDERQATYANLTRQMVCETEPSEKPSMEKNVSAKFLACDWMEPSVR